MHPPDIPQIIPNWIDGREAQALAGETFAKHAPATGEEICRVARSRSADVARALDAARAAFPAWSAQTPVARGDCLMNIARALHRHRERIAAVVAAETGMSLKAALAETGGAVAQGEFTAGEGRRLYGRTTTSAAANKWAMTVREPLGIAGLIIAANTPIANVAWKVFPALVCGNTAVLKAAEDTPATAWLFGRLAHEAGLPPGVLNIVQGLGEEAGAPLAADSRVAVVSFTGSTAVGREIARVTGSRLARCSLELGGKNPLVVCDDADLDNAAHWAVLSAYSNAGQRCAAGSRIIVCEPVYAAFRAMLVERIRRLKVGPGDEDDFGPVINAGQLEAILAAVARARTAGAAVLTGGFRLEDPAHAGGFYLAPTLIENAAPDAEISTTEIFGPVVVILKAASLDEAITIINDHEYGNGASIYTQSGYYARRFKLEAQAGMIGINVGIPAPVAYLPFGGMKESQFADIKAQGRAIIDFYTEQKIITERYWPEQD